MRVANALKPSAGSPLLIKAGYTYSILSRCYARIALLGVYNRATGSHPTLAPSRSTLSVKLPSTPVAAHVLNRCLSWLGKVSEDTTKKAPATHTGVFKAASEHTPSFTAAAFSHRTLRDIQR